MWVWGTKLKQRSLVSLHSLLSLDSLKGVRVPLPPDAGRFPFTGEIYFLLSWRQMGESVAALHWPFLR